MLGQATNHSCTESVEEKWFTKKHSSKCTLNKNSFQTTKKKVIQYEYILTVDQSLVAVEGISCEEFIIWM